MCIIKVMDDWKNTDINVDSLWLIDKRDNSGKHENNYHGNFVPQIPYQLLKRYTKKGDTVLETFSGSGTTLYECEKLGRNYIGFDINSEINEYVKSKMKDTSIKFDLINTDVTNEEQFNEQLKKSLDSQNITSIDFLLSHPPYWDIVKFTDNSKDLSNIKDMDVFLEKIKIAFKNGLRFLKKDGYFAVVMGDVYKKGEVVPLGFYVMDIIKKNFNVKLKGIVVKNIEGNRGKLGTTDIWKYRALRSDYFIFKHEYIFVFKKEF